MPIGHAHLWAQDMSHITVNTVITKDEDGALLQKRPKTQDNMLDAIGLAAERNY